VFFNTAVWAMAASLGTARFGLALAIFVVIAAAFVVQETMEHAKPTLMAATASSRHAERLADTPFEHMPDPAEVRPLTRGERFNLVFVLAATQLARIFTVAVVTWVAGPQELVHFFVRVDFICALQWHPTQLVAGRRVQCPASNSMGRVVGPLSAVSGFHGAGPVRRALGMRRVITARASANSRRARWAPRQ
jgi:hypothetical protein